MRQSERAPARGPRTQESGGQPKGNTLRPEVLDGRARFLTDATGRAFAAGVRFTLERLAALSESDPVTLRAYTRLLQTVNGAR